MEATDPGMIWIMPMGYEVEENILKVYAEHLLSMPLDTTEERFGCYAEKSMQLDDQSHKPKIVRRVRKEVELVVQFLHTCPFESRDPLFFSSLLFS